MRNNILVAGGGIGGLCAAIALHQRGLPVRVYEAVAQAKPVGAGILLAPNALEILARLGLEQGAIQRGILLDSLGAQNFGIVDTRGRMLVPGFDLVQMRREFGRGLVALTRAELHALLMAALPSDVLTFGKRIQQIEERNEKVYLNFEDGSTTHGDILLGADGLRSVVRRHLFPDIQTQYSGQTSYRGLLDIAVSELGALPCAEVWGSKIRFGYTPVSSSRAYWYATRLAPAGETPLPPAEMKAQLLAQVSDLPAVVSRLVTRTPDAALIQTDMHELPKLPAWHRGRIGLIGDAAHAMTPNLGQGGCQAIEDGYAIALCLAEAQSHEDAFVRFEQLRKARAEQVAATARQLGRMVHLRPWQQTLRNGVLRVLPMQRLARQGTAFYRVGY